MGLDVSGNKQQADGVSEGAGSQSMQEMEAVLPTAGPEMKPTQQEDIVFNNQPKKAGRKSRRWLVIAGGIVAAMLVIVIIVILLVARPANNDGGVSSGEPAVPTVALARQACTAQGSEFREKDVSAVTMDENFQRVITGVYECEPQYGGDGEIVGFLFMTFNQDYQKLDYVNDMIIGQLDYETLEKSDEFFKAYNIVDPYYMYVGFYKNTGIELYATSIDAAEATLATMAYPDRNHLDLEAEAAARVEREARAGEVAQYVASALERYRTETGHYPAFPEVIYEDEDDYDEYDEYLYEDYVDGKGNTEFDTFYNKYLAGDEFKNSEGGRYRLYASKYPAVYYAYEPYMAIHYNSICENGEVVEVDDVNRYAVTYPKTGQTEYFCFGN